MVPTIVDKWVIWIGGKHGHWQVDEYSWIYVMDSAAP